MVYVSRYEEALKESLDEAIGKLPEQHEQMINKITDTICEAIQEQVRSHTVDYLAESIKDDICKRAAEVAESMLMNALAGDDSTIRNLFGFNDYSMRSLYMGKLPTQWALIDAIAERKPDLLVDERIKQRDAELAEAKRETARLHKYNDSLRAKLEDAA